MFVSDCLPLARRGDVPHTRIKVIYMHTFSIIFVSVVALEHLYILWIEMFAWTTVGKKTFTGFPPDLFEQTKVLAANQGLYNGFLAGGLIWALFVENEEWARNIAVFFLLCVIVAGLYGGFTASRSIIIKQALPALIALVVLLLEV